MPGYDRTGPMGEGPKTGGGFGLCGTGTRRAVGGAYYGVGRGGRPFGGGRGRCFGGGRGFGRRYNANRFGYANQPMPTQDQMAVLQDEIKLLEQDLAELKAQKQQLENTRKKETE